MDNQVSGRGSFVYADTAQAAGIARSFAPREHSFLRPGDLHVQGNTVAIRVDRAASNAELPEGLGDLQLLARSAISGVVDLGVKRWQQSFRIVADGTVSCHWADRPLAPGDGPLLTRLHHPVSAFAVAFSARGTYVAIGGGTTALAVIYDRLRGDADPDAYSRLADVTVWECATGRQVGRLRGLRDEVAALAFSRDERRLVGVSSRAQRCTWDLATGELLQQGAPTMGRAFLSLTTLDADPQAEPVLLATPRKGGRAGRVLAPDGRCTVQPTVSGLVVKRHPSGKPLAELILADYALSPANAVCWTDDSRAVGAVGDDWCGLWLPDTGHFTARSHPAPDDLHALAILPGTFTVLCATGERTLQQIDLPTPADPPTLNAWGRFKEYVDRITLASGEVQPSDWRWRETSDGYEGVQIEGDQLIWYSHARNPHAGGGVTVQPLSEFLIQGPGANLPAEAAHLLPDLYRAVKRASGLVTA